MSVFKLLVVAGGGSGGASSTIGGGGGAGQVSYNSSLSLSQGSYTVTVGTGGTVSTAPINGNPGNNSSFGSILSSSGGLGGILGAASGGASGSGKTGGAGYSSSQQAGGGGGGDSGNGGNASSGTGGSGGTGTSNSISGSAVTYSVGGGGGSVTSGSTGSTAGSGGIGGDAFADPAGAGYNGVVVLSVPTASIVATGGTKTNSGGNDIYTFTTSGTFSFTSTRYWVGGTGNWDGSTTTHWSYTSGGSGGAVIPTSIDNVVFDANSGAGTVTISATANCSNLTTTGSTVNITGSNALNVYGNLTLSSSVLSSYTGTLTFAATTTGFTITGASNNLGTVVFNGSGGGWTLQDNWSAVSVTLTAGTLAASSRTITLTGTGTVWTGGATFTAGTSTIVISDTSSSSKTFAGGGLTYYNLTFTGGTGTHIITGSNTFNAIAITTPPSTIQFTAGTTTTMSSSAFTVSGTAGNLNVFQSTSNGSAWNLAQSFTGNVVCDYISLQDSHVI